MPEMKITDEQLTAMITSGLTAKQIAEECDVSEQTVRRRSRLRGLTLHKQTYQTVRQRAELMTPRQAVDYLLDVLETLHAAMCGEPNHEVDTWGVHLTPMERRVLIVIIDTPAEHVCTRDQIFAAMNLVRDTRYSDAVSMAGVVIHKLRRKLPAEHGHIHNVWGTGYRFVRPQSTPTGPCERREH